MTINSYAQPETVGQRYALNNSASTAAPHHQALAAMLDPFTQWRIQRLTPDLSGARVLEIGPGHGSIAHWLAEQVDAEGEVVAIDLDISRIPLHKRITLIADDLTVNGLRSIPGQFDLVHARLTLHHLPTRETLLSEMVKRLAPGGILLIQDWAGRDRDVVVQAPSPQDRELVERYQWHVSKIFDASGTDRTWGTRTHFALQQEGLEDVQTMVFEEYWAAGSPGLQLMTAVARQLRAKLIARGLTTEDLDQLHQVLRHPMLVLRGHPMFSVSGRRPE